ncbi:glycosyltransferase [Leucobacter luti]|uniref:glycosyltransferase n=1 Tax=Leucobacter luti TaxID=340320 RepID=UPI003D04C9FD
MRFFLAIATLVLSGVLLLLGLGQRTFLAGPAEISFPVDTQTETGYAVVDGAEFAKVPGQANVVVQGAQAFVATGMTRDVHAWVEPYSHSQLTVDPTGKRLLSALVAPSVTDEGDATAEGTTDGAAQASDEKDAVLGEDPRGSDLWLEERSIDDSGTGVEAETLRFPVALAKDQSVLIASNGADPVPEKVSLVWAQDRQTPWAGPLLVAGAVLALVGGVLYLLAVDHDRRGLGPRRGRRGPLQGIRNMFGGRRSGGKTGRSEGNGAKVQESGSGSAFEASTVRRARRLALPAIGLAVGLGLSGCSANYWPQTGPTETQATPTEQPSSVAPVPVTDGQLSNIVKRVAAVANTSDDELDATKLEERFSGDALAQRTANFKIREAMPDYAVVPPRITDQELDYELVQSTESWPRTIFVTVASKPGGDKAAGDQAAGDATAGDATAGDAPAEGADTPAEESSPSLALVLTQQNPHENYLVSRVISLRGGISMPDAAPAEEGTAVLSNEAATLAMAPGEVGAAYAKLLQDGTEIPEAEAFDLTADSLLQNYGKARAAAAQKQSDEKGQTMKFSVATKQGDTAPIALSTGAGGALVATTVIEEQVVDSAGGRYKPQAKDAVTALSGLEGEQDKLVQEVAHQMLFYVPSKSENAKIQLLGVTSELVGVRN